MIGKNTELERKAAPFSLPLNISEVRTQIENGHGWRIVERSDEILSRLANQRRTLMESFTGNSNCREFWRLIIEEDPYLITTPVFLKAATKTKQDFRQIIEDLFKPKSGFDRVPLIDQLLSFREYVNLSDDLLIQILGKYGDSTESILRYSMKFSPDSIRKFLQNNSGYPELQIVTNAEFSEENFIRIFSKTLGKNRHGWKISLESLDYNFKQLSTLGKGQVVDLIFKSAEILADDEVEIFDLILSKLDFIGKYLSESHIDMLAKRVGSKIMYFIGYLPSTPYLDSINLAAMQFGSDNHLTQFFINTDNFLALCRWIKIRDGVLVTSRDELDDLLLVKIRQHYTKGNFATCKEAISCIKNIPDDFEIDSRNIEIQIAKRAADKNKSISERAFHIIDVRRLVFRFILAAEMHNELMTIEKARTEGVNNLYGMLSREIRREDLRKITELTEFCQNSIAEAISELRFYLHQIVRDELRFQAKVGADKIAYLPYGKIFFSNSDSEEARLFFRRARYVFQQNWGDNFGGKAWQIIAECGEQIWSDNISIGEAVVIIDRTIQCQHNTGGIFKALPYTRWSGDISPEFLAMISDRKMTIEVLIEKMASCEVLSHEEYQKFNEMQKWIKLLTIHSEDQ